MSAISFADRRGSILSLIDEEIDETTRLIKEVGNRDPDLLLRIAELHLEKARLYQEAENERYLAIPSSQRRKVSRKKYFAQSRKEFSSSNKYAYTLAQKYSRYSNVGDAYYILAYNYRELGSYQKSEKYFRLASRKARKGTKVYYKSKLALADSYYNKRKYSRAIPLYEDALSHLDETWWTKDSFNLAWCYYRVKKYPLAINKMKQVYQKSKNEKYVDMRDYVTRDIGLFFVNSGNTSEGVSFYRSLGIDYSSKLITIASSIIDEGKFTQAEKLLKAAYKETNDQQLKKEAMLLQLDLYEKFNKQAKHLKISKKLVEYEKNKLLNATEKKTLDYQVAKQAAQIQKSIVSGVYQKSRKITVQKRNYAIAYFSLLLQLREQKAETYFFQGETSYATKDYGDSINYYLKAHQQAKKENNQKIYRQSIDSALSALGQRRLGRSYKEKYYEPIYLAYLESDSRSKRGKIIYQKLYKVYLERKQLDKAEALIRRYKEDHPEDIKGQEAMLAGVMDIYRERKDYEKINYFLDQINQGVFNITPKYRNALKTVVTKIQIESAQLALDKGKKASALYSYLGIYKHERSTPKAKANAAYNLSALYFDLGDVEQTYHWAKIAIDEMTTKDMKSLSDSVLTIANFLFLKQDFIKAADLNIRVVAKLCRIGSSSKETAFKNGTFLFLAQGELDKALSLIEDAGKCSISPVLLDETRLELAKEYLERKDWEQLEREALTLEKSVRYSAHTIIFYDQIIKNYERINDREYVSKYRSKIFNLYQKANLRKQEIPVDALDAVARLLTQGMKEKAKELDLEKLSFPEESYNKLLKRKLALLDLITSDMNEIKKTGSGRGIVSAYQILIQSYEGLANEIKGFVPPGKSPEYRKSFSKAMQSVYRPIFQSASTLRNEVKKLIYDNEIISLESYSIIFPDVKPAAFYQPEVLPKMMDKWGRR